MNPEQTTMNHIRHGNPDSTGCRRALLPGIWLSPRLEGRYNGENPSIPWYRPGTACPDYYIEGFRQFRSTLYAPRSTFRSCSRRFRPSTPKLPQPFAAKSWATATLKVETRTDIRK